MSKQSAGTSYYEILEVAPTAAQAEVHRAYQRAKTTYSQDNPALYSMFSREEARELLRMIEEAYAVLGNPTLRRSYDESLANGHSTDSMAGAAAASHPVEHQVAQHKVTIESQHRNLPDFADPDPGTPSHPERLSYQRSQAQFGSTPTASMKGGEDMYSVRKKDSSSKSSLPPGMGRTTISTFKIDESFEAEISSATEFDGGFLQKIRQYKNISLEAMSDATRISRTYLNAVETNDYKTLPAAVFVRGFVVQVARILGLDETNVAASYMKMFKAGGGK